MLTSTLHRPLPFFLTSTPSSSPNTSLVVHPPTPIVDLESDAEEMGWRPPNLSNSITFTRVGTESKLLQEIGEVIKVLDNIIERARREKMQRGAEEREQERRGYIRQAVLEAKKMIEEIDDKMRS